MTQQTQPASVATLIQRTEAPQAPKTTIRKIALVGVCALATLTVAASNANATPLVLILPQRVVLLCQKLEESQCYQWVMGTHGLQENLVVSMR